MPPMAESKEHLSIVICGHVDSGKSTTTGRLIFEMGGIDERLMAKLQSEADTLGKSSFAFAFFMDRQKEERGRGVTISCTTKEFFTDKWHYTIIDAPGHRDFIKNMISGAAQADVCLLMVPADGNFTTAIQRGNHKAGEGQGQTRQHARLLNLLGVKQLIVGVNKMDTDVAKYSEERYVEIRDEMRNMLTKVGWKKDFVAKTVPVLPISGWMGDNLLKKSEKMNWWSGVDVETEKNGKVHVHTLKDALNDMVDVPQRETDEPLRLPISGIYKIKGVGDVLAGRVEQGLAKPGELKCGYSPIGFVRCGRAACRMTKIDFKIGKETGGKKMEDPHSLKSNEVAQVVFEPQQPLVVDTFKNCEGLSRIAFLDGNTAVMLGKVVKTTPKE